MSNSFPILQNQYLWLDTVKSIFNNDKQTVLALISEHPENSVNSRNLYQDTTV